MMLDEGLNRIRDLFSTNADRGQLGTGTTAEEFTDTALETPLSATKDVLTSTTADKFLIKQLDTDSLLGNGSSFSEFGLIKNSDSSQVSRSTFNGVSKNNTINIRTLERYFFK